ncbi:MAG: cold shock domain-containing protein [Candidatus Brocadia sp.]|nr:cold shock domain-containing protein [Candidatus Brocadia sp.]UJS16586.1 MAG: RAMP superfamily CRISPR-associated protein [Candidatus Jettenia sp.]
MKFIKDRVEYTIPKRCERIFCIPVKNTIEYKVSSKACKQYKDILIDYEKNFGHIDNIFTTKIQKRELTEGDLVYFIPNEGADKTVQAIMPVPLSRVTDSRTLGERLPHKNLLPCIHDVNEDLSSGMLDSLDKKLLSIHPEGLCPACRLFGTTYYKGRVRFGFANLMNKPKWLVERENGYGGYVTLPLLERPRLTWSVPSDKCDVPRRKFYVHHNGWQEVLRNNDITPKTENNRTVEPLAAGNRFTFDVHFENLREWELGLLCYCLELEPGMGHKLGMGKPLGFGSVKIAIEKLQTFTVHQDGINWKSSENEIGIYVQKGREKLVEWFIPLTPHKNMEWNKVEHIKDLRSLLSIPDNKPTVKYPILNKDAEGAIPDYTYERLSDTKLLPHDKRVEHLRTPWNPWNIFVKEAGYSPSEKSDEKGSGTIRTKPKSLPSVKSIGKVKWFDEGKGLGILVMDDGKEVSISKNSIRRNILLKKGQKVTFHIVQRLIPKAEDIEIAK